MDALQEPHTEKIGTGKLYLTILITSYNRIERAEKGNPATKGA